MAEKYFFQKAWFSKKFALNLCIDKKIKVMNNIKKGSIVTVINPELKIKGWYRVTRATSKSVNLGSIFGSHIYYKGVDINSVMEDEANWYKNWQKTETYQCM
jgi:hypothetical protein